MAQEKRASVLYGSTVEEMNELDDIEEIEQLDYTNATFYYQPLLESMRKSILSLNNSRKISRSSSMSGLTTDEFIERFLNMSLEDELDKEYDICEQ